MAVSRVGITCLFVLSAATACANAVPSSQTPPSATTAVFQSVAPGETTGATPDATRMSPSRTPVAPTGAITLTLWTTEDLSPGSTTAARVLLRNQFEAFTAANANIHIEPILKKPYGTGGLLDFLTTTSAVAPEELPDLAALDLSEIPQAASVGVLQPLDSLVPADVASDFFPFAYQAAHYRGKWIAVPFSADVDHLVYNRTTVRQPPRTWDDLVRLRSTLLLPLAGDDAFLDQYLAIAPLFDANKQITIDVDAAGEVLAFVKRAHDLGLLQDASIGLTNSDETWPTFLAGKVGMTQAPSSRFAADRGQVPDASYAALPTRDGNSSAVATGWAFVVVTNDPARQAAAVRFIRWLVQGEHLAPWLRAAHLLPADRSAVVLAVEPFDYGLFLQDQLEHAVYIPPSSAYNRVSDAWRTAVAAVWRGQTTPEEGARSIAAALK
ncbi:MAG: extracellular solute-binding protein [Chloroflexi bacterium]|nr:extracellular solute-binding protein [Chloroflexota bacterium]